MKLVIVESPTKARKLSQYLGADFVVEASVGHVRDLPKKKLGIDIEHNFEPTYEVDADKEGVVSKIKSLSKKAEMTFLATDPDREGEAIAWHISQLLESKEFVRATFHEITKTAVLEAMSHPSKIAMDLVDAQQARRVVDRLVGYQVSPVLWKKVRRGLSAGRVQSVALRMIVEREREIEAFKADEYWEVDVLLNTDLAKKTETAPKVILNPSDKEKKTDKPTWLDKAPESTLVGRVIEVGGKKYEPQKQDQIQPLVDELVKAGYWVETVEKKSRERSSLPPFTTSTLQQAAANKLGYTSKQTMTLAQQLYEEGLITYHRTDSVSLSQQSLEMVRTYISSHFDKSYLPEKPRFFSNTSKNAQEAHEAIRVTDSALDPENIYKESSKFTDRHAKLYDLIRRRFIASQMTSAAYDQTTITVAADPAVTGQPTSAQAVQPKYRLRSSGSILRFDGWMKLFPASEDTILPPVEQKQLLAYQAMAAAQKFTQPPARYNDASLVKELEKRGIGRPSTYASIISVIVDRGYVERLDKRFMATQVGMTVSDFLNKHFPVFMDYDFTAEMEDNLDRVSRGEKAWRGVVKEFYEPLAKIIDSVTKDADRVQIPVEKTGEMCPTCGETEHGEVVIRTGRFGKFKSCSRFPDCSYTENLVEKLENVACPLCQQGEVVIKNSRWGKSFFGCSRYPECSWASWKKPEAGFIITPAEWEAQQAERAARKAEREASGKTGRFGASKTTKTKAKATTKKKTATKTKTVAKKTTKTTTKKKAAA